MDEATSSVDPYTESLIQTSLHSLTANRTSIIIAHRLSTIEDADKILVIDNGKLIEMGNHKELLDLKGFYYKLHLTQNITEGEPTVTEEI